MASKALVVTGLLFALSLVNFSEVAARDLAEVVNEKEQEDAHVEDADYGGGYSPGHGGRGGYGGYRGRGGYGGYPGRGGYGGGCRYYCYRRCCSNAEAAELEAEAQTHN